ncbi:MAG: FAD-dependent monooxygenase, partial [Hyphomicrobiales bacterium]|nr:FAD-dependent monooxygenase [Hyphomicrobiales bacterium]
WELEWWSIYSANTLLLDDYRDGRIFFIGDSAHIVPIFGVRGLNNGLSDAQNIGWKLALVLQGKASEKLLDSYTPERRGATLDVFANASKSARFMTPHSRGWSVLRDAALSLALDHPFAGEFANPRNMTPYSYAGSPVTLPDTDAFATGPVPGAAALNVRLESHFLLDLFGHGFTVLHFGPLAQREVISGITPGVAFVEQPADGAAAHRYDAIAGTAYLIRPDGHVAARWKQADSATIAATLRRMLDGKVRGDA